MEQRMILIIFFAFFFLAACTPNEHKNSNEGVANDSAHSAQGNVDKLMASDYAKIMEYHVDFGARAGNSVKAFPFLQFYDADSTLINSILRSEDCKYVIAVLGVDNAKSFSVDFIGSNKDGTEGLPGSNPDYEKIKEKNKALIDLLDPSNLPLGLDDFPLLIKMEKDDFNTIRDLTKCPKYFGYLGIDPTDVQHLTVSILGCDKEGFRVNPMHINDNLPGGETWPIANFTFLKKSQAGDTKLP
jgi:hypothetical protein